MDLRCPLKTHRYSIDIVHGATGREWEFEEEKSDRRKLGHGEYALKGILIMANNVVMRHQDRKQLNGGKGWFDIHFPSHNSLREAKAGAQTRQEREGRS